MSVTGTNCVVGISHYPRVTSVVQVQAEGVGGVICKACEGAHGVDSGDAATVRLFSGRAVRWGSWHLASGDPAVHQVENDPRGPACASRQGWVGSTAEASRVRASGAGSGGPSGRGFGRHPRLARYFSRPYIGRELARRRRRHNLKMAIGDRAEAGCPRVFRGAGTGSEPGRRGTTLRPHRPRAGSLRDPAVSRRKGHHSHG